MYWEDACGLSLSSALSQTIGIFHNLVVPQHVAVAADTTTMKHRYSVLCLTLVMLQAASAQYCTPTFLNGCFSWQNQQVSIADLNWTTDGVCENGDVTDQMATVTAGATVPMSVTSGNWTGCAVWVDLDNNGDFSEAENMHYEYVGGDPGYTYDFTITIPASTPTSQYRMRVIAGWGSDGFLSTNTNGYGPCGEYQYGNYNDFTLNVIGTVGIALIDELGSELMAWPNPVIDVVTLNTSSHDRIEQIDIWSSDGKLMRRFTSTSIGQMTLDLSDLTAGVYHLGCITEHGTRLVRILKL